MNIFNKVMKHLSVRAVSRRYFILIMTILIDIDFDTILSFIFLVFAISICLISFVFYPKTTSREVFKSFK